MTFVIKEEVWIVCVRQWSFKHPYTTLNNKTFSNDLASLMYAKVQDQP